MKPGASKRTPAEPMEVCAMKLQRILSGLAVAGVVMFVTATASGRNEPPAPPPVSDQVQQQNETPVEKVPDLGDCAGVDCFQIPASQSTKGGDSDTPAADCPSGRVQCRGPQPEQTMQCVDLRIDADNCGSCGNRCPSGLCNAGQCSKGF